MSINNEIQVEAKSNKLKIYDNNSNLVNINHEDCYDPSYRGKVWCKECVPCCIIEGWTSENHDIDEFYQGYDL